MDWRMGLRSRTAHFPEFSAQMGAIREAEFCHDSFVGPALRNQFLSHANPKFPGPSHGCPMKLLCEMTFQLTQRDGAKRGYGGRSEFRIPRHSFPISSFQQWHAH